MNRLIKIQTVMQLTGLGRTSIYERMALGTFPKSVQIDGGPAVRWIESEVLAWIATQVSGRDHPAASKTARR